MTKQTFWLASSVWLALSAGAWAIELDITLDPGQSVPPPVLGGATPSGNATIDVNTITGGISVTGSFSGLTSNAAAAHIHGLAPAGAAAGVLIPLTADSAASGSITGGGTLSSGDLAGLLRGETYVNLHTANNGPGEIRGQIVDADIRVYTLALDASQANPAPDLGGATPSGSATVVVDTSSGMIEVSGSYAGMTSNVGAAHLHGLADLGSNAGVLVPFDVAGGTDGLFSATATLDADTLTGLLDGKTYINVHTAQNGAGEIRAQVVPEPGAIVLMLLGLLFSVLSRRRG